MCESEFLPPVESAHGLVSYDLDAYRRLIAAGLAVAYIGAISLMATATGAFYLLFPELGALSYDVLGRPRGRWASAPVMLAITPMLVGAIGTATARTMPYGFASVLVTVIGAIAALLMLRSPVGPAISAGLLPLTVGVKSWWYPLGVLFSCVVLTLISAWWKRYAAAATDAPSPTHDRGNAKETRQDSIVPALFAMLIFIAVAVVVVKLTRLRFILFPPLAVILFEMLRDPAECPWAGSANRLVRLPIVCCLCAAGGLFVHNAIPIAPLAAMLSMAWGICILRLSRLHVPPALAVALLPMVMDHPAATYPLAVAIGTAGAAAWFAAFESWFEDRGPGPVPTPGA
jgi:hypothetical protein